MKYGYELPQNLTQYAFYSEKEILLPHVSV